MNLKYLLERPTEMLQLKRKVWFIWMIFWLDICWTLWKSAGEQGIANKLFMSKAFDPLEYEAQKAGYVRHVTCSWCFPWAHCWERDKDEL